MKNPQKITEPELEQLQQQKKEILEKVIRKEFDKTTRILKALK
jgi:hypothetical protein